ncbi:hypothetical protein NEOLEDRAFT_1127111 [Neolentinus lepideus HHB14362 ss-1]|uniref:Uncharacterized protein n=1 Tax=Neolentinus lepideus HHB14362 ss-1 TaxID=1314782 RepID=A0A165VU90_9AGAM|nr:hypothetical protein NEOLEDRAFT_1127111 [Neolentinus lepideus HHB14362 ss-1]
MPQVNNAVTALDRELEQDYENLMQAVASLRHHDDSLSCWPPPQTHSIQFSPFDDLDVQQLDGTSDYDISPFSLPRIITPPNDIMTVTSQKSLTPFANNADEIVLDRRDPVELHVIRPPPTAARRKKRQQLLNQLLAEIEEGAHIVDSQRKCW